LFDRHRRQFGLAARIGGLSREKLASVLDVPDKTGRTENFVFILGSAVAISRAEPQEEIPPATSWRWTPPYESEFSFVIGTGNAENPGYAPDVDANTGETSVSVDTEATFRAGTLLGDALVGINFTAPPGYSRMRVSVEVEYTYHLSCFAAGGGASTESKLMMHLEGPSADGSSFTPTEHHNRTHAIRLHRIRAYGGWSGSDYDHGTRLCTKRFDVPDSGGTYLFLTGGWAKVVAGGVRASSTARTDANITSIYIDLER
ncbi:MAG: hypothetical protein HQ582_10510, partial [Planctomycetes bacterium]|nr:hypothetical protein [Planctomycetota bacterium]